MRFFLLILFVTSLIASQKQVLLYTSDAQMQGNTVYLNRDVVVAYGNYIISAERAKYNKETGILELYNNVRISDNNHQKVLGSYAWIDIKDKKRIIRPFYLFDQPSKVWVSADDGCSSGEEVDIASGTISGCDPKDPLWQIDFSSSDYNEKTKWLNVYNAVLYIYDIPLFYTPYFGYSLDHTRRTGFLTPSFGYSNTEGFFYSQPFYIAEQSWWDLELDPQIRTNRGSGLYGTFRFVDSKVSRGSIHFGYFKEQQEYYIAENLANQTHYGVNLNYINNDFLSTWFDVKHNGQAVVFVETNTMNDVDYVNLATNDTSRNITASQTLSRINAFYNTEEQYLATYVKYYMDLTQENNSNTLQQLPTLHYHNYLSAFFDDHLLYNFNAKVNNLYRSQGTTATQTNIDIPIALRTSLFDEYIDISYQTQLFGQYSSFGFDGNQTLAPKFQNGYYARNYNIFSVATQLTKPYKDFTHSMSFSSSYTKSGFEKRSGFYEENKGVDCRDPQNSEVCEFYNIANIQEAITLNFSHYIYDLDNKQLMYHRLTNIISKNDDAYTVGELENELDVALGKHWSFYNNFLYNFDETAFSKQFNKITFRYEGLKLALSHLYKKNLLIEDSARTSYITSSFNYRYNAHYSYNASLDYDTEAKLKKRMKLGFLYQKRCWDFGLLYIENNRPVLLNNNTPSSVYDRYIYLTLVLKPIMGKSSSGFFGIRLPEVLPGS